MDILDWNSFMEKTMGGMPLNADMSIYEGLTFECACGDVHEFDTHSCNVLRELKRMTFVISPKYCGGINAVKVKGLFKVSMETQFGTNPPEGN